MLTKLPERIRNYFAVFILLSINAIAGVHVTMSASNCVQTSSNCINIDLYIVNDGSSSIALNSLSYGLNVNTDIINGGNLSWSFIVGTSGLPSAITNTFSYNYNPAFHELRLQSDPLAVDYTSAPSLPLGVRVKAGTFSICNTNPWAACSIDSLALQTTDQTNLTNTLILAYANGATNLTTLDLTGINRDVSVNSSIILNFLSPSSPLAGNNGPACSGSAVNLTSTVNIGNTTHLNYLWAGPLSYSSSLQNPAIAGAALAAGGTYTVTIANACGSTSTTTLVVMKATSVSANSAAACNSYVWNGNTYFTSGDKVYHTINAAGCDSAVTLHLTINHNSSSSNSITACESYVWNGSTYTSSTVVIKHFANAAGCDSATTLHLSIINVCTATLSLKMFIQGYYQNFGSTTPMNNFGAGGCLFALGVSSDPTEVDTVTVSLMDLNTQSQVGTSVKGILHSDGSVWENNSNVIVFPGSTSGNSYYIKINHRSGIETWSENPVLIGSATVYDFSKSIDQAFGSNMVLVDSINEKGVYAFWSGDVDDYNNSIPYAQDGVIEGGDYGLMEEDYTSVLFGYVCTDLTGDGVVESADYGLIETNYTIVVFKATPW